MRCSAGRATTGLVLGHLALTTALAWATSGTLASTLRPGPVPPDAAVGLAAAAAAWTLLSWVTVRTATVLLAAARHGAGSRAHARAAAAAPAVARRLAGLLLGTALVAAGPSPVPVDAAGRPPTPPTPSAAGRVAAADAGVPDRPAAPAGWTPDRPAPARRVAVQAPTHLVAGRPRPAPVAEVVVRRGDTLWGLAARRLGPDASAAEVAAEWPRWYAANRRVIGPDPDLLRPGQRLVPPSPHDPRSTS